MRNVLVALHLLLMLAGCGGMTVSQPHKTIRVNGTELAYVEKGQGQPIVLVHGTLGDYRDWEAQLDSFSRRYRVIAVSLRGHYPNPPPTESGDVAIPTQVKDLIGFLDAMRLGPVHLIGHSRGGAPVVLTALQRPDLIRTLVLADAPMFSLAVGDPLVKAWVDEIATVRAETIALLQKEQPEQAMRRYFSHFYGPAGFERLPSAIQSKKLENISTLRPLVTVPAPPPQSFTCDHAKRISAPTLLLGGELSVRSWKLVLDELGKCLPNSQRVTISGGHGLPMENPSAFNREVLRFLRDR